MRPRHKGKSWLSFLEKPFVKYKIVPHFKNMNLRFQVKLETESFSLSNVLIDKLFSGMLDPDFISIPIPLSKA